MEQQEPWTKSKQSIIIFLSIIKNYVKLITHHRYNRNFSFSFMRSYHRKEIYRFNFSSTILDTIFSSMLKSPPADAADPAKYACTLFSTYLPTISISTLT